VEVDPTPSLDVREAVSFPFSDRAWLSKCLVGAAFVVLSLFLVGLPVVLGYLRRLFLEVVRDPRSPLPEWEPGADFRDGLPSVLVLAAYGAAALLGSMVPAVGFFVSASIAFLVPAALTHLYAHGRLAAAFDLSWIAEYVRDNLGNYAIAFAVILASCLVGALGVLLLVVGVFLTAFWAALASVHAMAQVYRNSRLLTAHPVVVAVEQPSLATAAASAAAPATS
jgi:hypothetical protein